MDSPRVSVIIPAYKCAEIIGDTLHSLRAQTRRPDEIIVVDDGSPDDIAGAVRPFPEVRLLRKVNGGASSARNAGLDVCTGDLVAFVDSDDLWYPQKLESQLAVFAAHPEVGLVSSRYRIRTRNGENDDFPAAGDVPLDEVLRVGGPEAFRLAMYVWTSVVIFRREVLGTHRFDTSLKCAEDRDLWVRLVSRAPIYLQSSVTAILVEQENSLSRKSLDLDCQSMLRMIGHYQQLLGRRGMRQWEASVYRRWAGTYISRGQGREALRPAWCRLGYQPLSPQAWWVLGKAWMFCLRQRATSQLQAAAAAG